MCIRGNYTLDVASGRTFDTSPDKTFYASGKQVSAAGKDLGEDKEILPIPLAAQDPPLAAMAAVIALMQAWPYHATM